MPDQSNWDYDEDTDIQEADSWSSYHVHVNEYGDVEGLPSGLVNDENLTPSEAEQVKRHGLKNRIKSTEREIATIKKTSTQLHKGQSANHLKLGTTCSNL